MSQFFQIHPENPQARLIKQAVEIIKKGGVVIYPTDSSYAVGCQMGDKGAIERIKRLRNLDDKHNFTLMCCDLSQLGLFAKVDTGTFRLLKAHTPGPYTFILNATREVPRLLLHPKRRTIGLRVPSHPIALASASRLPPCWASAPPALNTAPPQIALSTITCSPLSLHAPWACPRMPSPTVSI